MTAELTPNTQATLLLTAPLIVGKRAEPAELLAPKEYNQLARLLHEQDREPADLLDPGDWLDAVCQPFSRERIEALLGRGLLLSQALERWRAATLWVISRADEVYPRRFRDKLQARAPSILYGCGERALLERGGLAVVGSRHVDDTLREYAARIGTVAAEAGRPIISGGARGIDQSAMSGSLRAGGESAGVMADSLERAALTSANRKPLHDGKLVLVSPYDPAAGFNVGHAMQRNKLIYALADAGLVVNADFEKGGTWTGAVEQLDKYKFTPVFIRNAGGENPGCTALIQRGGIPWPEPANAGEFAQALAKPPPPVDSPAEQEELPLFG